MSLNDLTEILQLPKSTVHGLCTTLAYTGLIQRFENGAYHLGVRVMDLAHAYLSRTDLTADFLKILEEMKPMPEETIVLSVLDNAEVVYLARRKGTRLFGFDFHMGMRLPANCAASGKVLLSTLPPEQVIAMTEGGSFKQLTPNSLTNSDALMTQLEETRQRGYAIDDEETRRGMVCIGAPVFGPASSKAIAAVGVSMPKNAVDYNQKSRAIDVVTTIAATLSKRLGAG